MYEDVPPNFFAAVLVAAKALVAAERKPFEAPLRAVELYASERKMFLSGAAASALLTGSGRPESLDFFSETAQAHAKNLVPPLEESLEGSEELGGALVAFMRMGQDARLEVAGRTVCVIRQLRPHRTTTLGSFIKPVPVAGAYSDAALSALPYEILLLDIYKRLMSPFYFGQWGELVAAERFMRQKFSEIRGGGEESLKDMVRLAQRKLRTEFAPGRVAVGNWIRDAGDRIQLISVGDLGDERRALLDLFSTGGGAVPLKVQASIDAMAIPTEPASSRLTLYVSKGVERRSVMDVYGYGVRELVPYSVAGSADGSVKTGSPFVQLRILFVNYWTIQLLAAMKVIRPDFAEGKLARFRKEIVEVGRLVDSALASGEPGDAARVFPPSYLGSFENPELMEKRQALASSRRHAEHFPDPK